MGWRMGGGNVGDEVGKKMVRGLRKVGDGIRKRWEKVRRWGMGKVGRWGG